MARRKPEQPIILPKLNIPAEINVYTEIKQFAARDRDARMLIDALHRVFQAFHIKETRYADTGNAVLRFSMWMSMTEEPVRITSKDRTLHRLADLYEALNREFPNMETAFRLIQ